MGGDTILLVDDDDVFRGVAARVLRNAGYQVREAVDGSHALEVLATAAPALLVTDVFMPNSDGIELIGEVRANSPDVRILAMSGRRFMAAVDLLQMMERLGAHATLDKPFSGDELLSKVQDLIGPAPVR